MGGVTPKGKATRRSFQEAARRVFARDGYINARLSDIADEAGKSMASFYNYYESKEALLADIAADFDEQIQERVAEAFRRGLPPEEALREAISLFWHYYRERMPEMVGVFHASIVDRTFAQWWREIHNNGVRTVARGIEAAQAHGYAPGLDPLIAASALSSMVEHFCYVWHFQGGEMTDAVELDDDHAVETLWTLWRHAVYWREPGS